MSAAASNSASNTNVKKRKADDEAEDNAKGDFDVYRKSLDTARELFNEDRRIMIEGDTLRICVENRSAVEAYLYEKRRKLQIRIFSEVLLVYQGLNDYYIITDIRSRNHRKFIEAKIQYRTKSTPCEPHMHRLFVFNTWEQNANHVTSNEFCKEFAAKDIDQ